MGRASVRTAAQSEARLGGWAIGAVWLYTVVQVASTAATVATLPALVRYVRQVFNGLGTMAAPPPQPPALFHATGSFQLPLVVVSGAVFLVWQYRAATTARALGYPARRSPALGAWSWVIPVLNLWSPYQAMRDLLPPGTPCAPSCFGRGSATCSRSWPWSWPTWRPSPRAVPARS